MSIRKETFLIVGCDIKDYLTEKFEDWYWSDEGEKYQDFQSEGNIQIIDDGMNGRYKYLGYIISKLDEDDYSYNCKELDLHHLSDYTLLVLNELKKLYDIGIINKDKYEDINIKVILFSHVS